MYCQVLIWLKPVNITTQVTYLCPSVPPFQREFQGMNMRIQRKISHTVVSSSLRSQWTVARQVLCSWNSPGKSTGVGCHSLLQGSSRPRDQTWVSCTAGRFFSNWATRKYAAFYQRTVCCRRIRLLWGDHGQCRQWYQPVVHVCALLLLLPSPPGVTEKLRCKGCS